MCSGSEAGSYLRFIGFGCHSTHGLKVMKKKRRCDKRRKQVSRLATENKGGTNKKDLFVSPL